MTVELRPCGCPVNAYHSKDCPGAPPAVETEPSFDQWRVDAICAHVVGEGRWAASGPTEKFYARENVVKLLNAAVVEGWTAPPAPAIGREHVTYPTSERVRQIATALAKEDAELLDRLGSDHNTPGGKS